MARLTSLIKKAIKSPFKIKKYVQRELERVPFPKSLAGIILSRTQLNNDNFSKAAVHEVENYEAFLQYDKKMELVYAKRLQIEKLLAMDGKKFSITGYNPMISQFSTYDVNYDYSYYDIEGVKVPNYRESLVCNKTGSNSRMRATVMAIQHILGNKKNIDVYLTEQVTQLYHYYKDRYSNVTGSEYLGDDTAKGTIINGIRHEDVTDLSFGNNSFDLIITLEVLEHVPDYKKSYQELYRCTKEGGLVLISVPFNTSSFENIIRARINENGETEHLLPPEYHGDPVNPEGGILCYQHFGWQMLDELRAVGFREVKSIFVWSLYHGILGKDIMVIAARK